MNGAQQRYLQRLECSFDRLELELLFRRRRAGPLSALLDRAANGGLPPAAWVAIDLLSMPQVRDLLMRGARLAAHGKTPNDPGNGRSNSPDGESISQKERRR